MAPDRDVVAVHRLLRAKGGEKGKEETRWEEEYREMNPDEDPATPERLRELRLAVTGCSLHVSSGQTLLLDCAQCACEHSSARRR